MYKNDTNNLTLQNNTALNNVHAQIAMHTLHSRVITVINIFITAYKISKQPAVAQNLKSHPKSRKNRSGSD